MQQEKTEVLQQKNDALERNVSEVVAENRHLREPLATANNELMEMRAKTDDYDNMKSILQVCLLYLAYCWPPVQWRNRRIQDIAKRDSFVWGLERI